VTKIVPDITPPRVAAQALAQSEARFRALSDASPIGVFATDTAGLCTYTNMRWQEIYGLTHDQALGTGWAEALHPQDRVLVFDEWQRSASARTEFNLEFRVRRPDGLVRFVHSRARPVIDAADEVTGFVGSVEDVTERRALLNRITASEERVRRLYEQTPAMLHSIDEQGRLLSVSDRWLYKLGYTREEVIGRASIEFLTAASQRKARENVLPEFFATGHCEQIRYQMVTKSGAIIDVELSGILDRDDQGRPLHSMAVLEDVTERLRAERDLLAQRERLANIINGTQAGTWEWNVQTDVLHINARWAEMLGYAADELNPASNEAWRKLAHPGDLARSDAALERHLRGETSAYECEVRMRHKDGSWVWVHDHGKIITYNAQGTPECMAGIRLNITARKQQEQALKRSEDFLNRTGRLAGVGGWELDLRSNEITWSPETCRIHGLEPGYVPALDEAINFYAPEARAAIEGAVRLCIAQGTGWDLELPLIRADGQRIWVRAVGAVEYEDGQPVRLSGAFQDISERVRAQRQLEEQRELLEVTLKSIADAVITTDAQSRVNWLNPAAERMTGWPAQEANGRPLRQVFRTISHEAGPLVAATGGSAGPDGATRAPVKNGVLISRAGEQFGIEDSVAPIRNAVGETLGLVCVFRDVTEQRRLSGEMSHRAMHDALTGLQNRAAFEAWLQRALAKAREDGSEHVLLYIDLDQFKLVNDTCGHAVGDKLLQQVARILSGAVRSSDVLARLGGDEFAAILQDCPTEAAQRVAQKICDQMEAFRFQHDERRFRIGASIGLVPVDSRWASSAVIMQAADTSCYAAKEAGRNRVHVWVDADHALRARADQTRWAQRIEQALDEDRFELYFQRIEPIAPQSCGMHAEVLLRLREADGTLVPPGAFLPAAERFHLATRIDRWVLKHVTQWAQNHAADQAVELLSVNLSGQSSGDCAFHRHVLDVLAALPAQIVRLLCFEITETAAVTNLAEAAAFVQQVRNLGVRVALDDFGAGVSSFGYLKSIPVDFLKIDGQFIKNLLDDPLDRAAVICFVKVAKVVGVKTVAEFVDRADVLAELKTLGVDFAQGFLLHRPEALKELAIPH
jgi:diguanylate cyclase